MATMFPADREAQGQAGDFRERPARPDLDGKLETGSDQSAIEPFDAFPGGWHARTSGEPPVTRYRLTGVLTVRIASASGPGQGERSAICARAIAIHDRSQRSTVTAARKGAIFVIDLREAKSIPTMRRSGC